MFLSWGDKKILQIFLEYKWILKTGMAVLILASFLCCVYFLSETSEICLASGEPGILQINSTTIVLHYWKKRMSVLYVIFVFSVILIEEEKLPLFLFLSTFCSCHQRLSFCTPEMEVKSRK